jgi:hypothetical protein
VLNTNGKSVQTILQKLELTKIQFQKEALDIELSIMNFWFEYHQFKIWVKISNLNHRLNPEINMMNLVLTKAVSEKIMVNQQSHGIFHQLCQLDNLKIPSIEMFPASMKPNKFYLRYKSVLLAKLDVIKAVEEKICLVNGRSTKTDISKKHFKMEGFPMAIYEHESVDKYRLRIIIKSVNNHYAEHVNCKMNFLVWSLNMCHQQLISLMKSKKMKLVPNAIGGIKYTKFTVRNQSIIQKSFS